MPAGRTLRVISFNYAGVNLPQNIDQIRDEDCGRLVELNLLSWMTLICALDLGNRVVSAHDVF